MIYFVHLTPSHLLFVLLRGGSVKFVVLSAFTISAFLFLGCAPTKSITSSIENLKSPAIINGSLVSADEALASHVVMVHDLKNNYVCTGALIAKNTVLTAAHCLSKKHNLFEIIFSRTAYKAMNEKNKISIRKASKIVIHEDYEFDENKAPASNQADIGLVYFEGYLPEGYAIANVMLESDLLQKGQNVILAGYGVSKLSYAEIKYKKSQKFQEKKKHGEIICNHNVYDADGDPVCVEIDMVDDGELRKTQAPIKYTMQSEFALDETRSGTCSGDSGGPVFVEKDEKVYLIGITSRGDLLCDSDGVYTSLPFYTDWLLTH